MNCQKPGQGIHDAGVPPPGSLRVEPLAMIDRLSPAERSRQMSRIRGQDTAPERLLRSALHVAGFRFRLHRRDLPGRPDLVLARHHAVIFVHGCFWHRHDGCASCYEPKSRVEFWFRKFKENVERDRLQIKRLKQSGWRVGIVWECGLKPASARATTFSAVTAWLHSDGANIQIPRKPHRCRPKVTVERLS